MAWKASFTGQYGKTDPADIALGAGTDEAQHDTITVNVDVGNMGKAEALNLIDKIRDAIHRSPWPPA